ADVTVQADQAQIVGVEDTRHRRQRVAGGDGEAELLVLVRGRDELVGVRVHTGRAADQDLGDNPGSTGDVVEALDLDHRVEHDVPDPGAHCGLQFGRRFVVAMQSDSLRREACVQRDGQFARGTDVECQPLVAYPAGNFAAQESLGRVVNSST